MKAFFNYLYWLFIGRPVKQKLRTGALYSLRMYINTISGARKASMFAVLGIMGLASIAVGFFLLVGGLLWFANLNPQAYPWIMVIVGGLLTLAGIVGYIYAFRQKLWVEMSRINEFTAQALVKLPANERPANPAVTGMWSLAAEARIREHSRLENTAKNFDLFNTEVPPIEHLAPTPQVPRARVEDRQVDPQLSPVF